MKKISGGKVEKVGISVGENTQSGFRITPEMRNTIMQGLPLFTRSSDNIESQQPDIEIGSYEALRGINRLQKAVRRYVGSRPARISKSLSINRLANGGGETAHWKLAKELARLFEQKVITFEIHTPSIFDFNGVSFEGSIYLNAK